MAEWASLWWWWLIAVAASWAGLEFVAVYRAGGRATYTLSDTIRRWAGWRPLAPLAWGTSVFLLVHFFGLPNR